MHSKPNWVALASGLFLLMSSGLVEALDPLHLPTPTPTPNLSPSPTPTITPTAPPVTTPTATPFVMPTAPPVVTPTISPSRPPSTPAPPPTGSFILSRSLRSTGAPATPPSVGSQGAYLSRVRDLIANVDLGPAQGPVQSLSLSSKEGIFDLVGVAPDQWVSLTVQYPLSEIGHRITVEPLDGGHIITSLGILLVGPDGVIHFQFQAGHFPGLNHVALHDAGREVGLQFWVLDLQHPERNPRVVNPGN
jgi:hypothetical protein